MYKELYILKTKMSNFKGVSLPLWAIIFIAVCLGLVVFAFFYYYGTKYLNHRYFRNYGSLGSESLVSNETIVGVKKRGGGKQRGKQQR